MNSKQIEIVLREISYLKLIKDIKESGVIKTKICIPQQGILNEKRFATKITPVLANIFKGYGTISKRREKLSWNITVDMLNLVDFKGNNRYEFEAYVRHNVKFLHLISRTHLYHCAPYYSRNDTITIFTQMWMGQILTLKYNHNWIAQALKLRDKIHKHFYLLTELYNEFRQLDKPKIRKKVMVDSIKEQLATNVPF